MTRLTLPVGTRDFTLGPASAPLTLVEYGDYECPHCAQADLIVRQLQDAHGERLRVVFRSFARVGGHSRAARAAEAAAAAGAQGRFWEMHTLLLARQQSLDEASLLMLPALYGDLLGLDTARFQRDLTERLHADRVSEDRASGVESGVKSTPTFFINEARHDDFWDLETLSAALDREKSDG